jgi:hypothetical protein
MNFGALMLLVVSYVFLAEEEMSNMYMKDAVFTTRGTGEGTDSNI